MRSFTDEAFAPAEIFKGLIGVQEFLKTVFFTVFFAIGAGALVLSLLSERLMVNYQNRQSLQQIHKNIDRLESLNNDYNALLINVEKDPNLLKRVATVTFGIEPNDPNTVYPKSELGQLNAARKALEEEANTVSQEPNIPSWLIRCSEHNKKLALFITGGFLILISFLCFRPGKAAASNKENK